MKAQSVSSGLRLLAVATSPSTCASAGTVLPATSIRSFRASSASSETWSPASALTSHRYSYPSSNPKVGSKIIARNKSSNASAFLPPCPGAQAGIRLFHNLSSTASTLSWRHPGRSGLTKQLPGPTHSLAPASWSRPPRAPHFTATSTRGHATCALAAEDHLGSISTTHNTTNTFDMGDRDLLPDSFKAAHYDLKLTNLDFKDWSYNGSVTYAILPLVAPPPAHELCACAAANLLPTASLETSPNPPMRSSSTLLS